MQLTKSNFRLYAIQAYDNPFCLSEDEFDSDLFKGSMIKKALTNYRQKDKINIRYFVNVVISYYNVFKHKEGTRILQYNMCEEHYESLNSVLTFLSFPTIEGIGLDSELLQKIEEEYK